MGISALDLRLARGDLPLAGLQHLAHHDVLDLLGLDAGALERGLDRHAAELGRVERGQAAAHLADGGACGPRITVLGIETELSLGWSERDAMEWTAMLVDPDRSMPPRAANRLSRYRPPAGPANTNPRPDADTVVLGVFEGEIPPARRARGGGRAARLGRGPPVVQGARRWLTPRAGAGSSWGSASARTSRPSAPASPQPSPASAPASCRAACSAGRCRPTAAPRSPAALVEGTILADYRFERHKSGPAADGRSQAEHLDRLILSSPGTSSGRRRVRARGRSGERGPRSAEPARQRPHPHRARRARSIARRDIELLTVEVDGREGIGSRGMGAFSAVAQGSDQEPALITLRYEGPARRRLGGRGWASSARR